MNKRTLNNTRLGIFVLVGTVFLIAALYLIGNNQNLFDRTFQLNATFYKVNGLMRGNNVRFSGIDVGTVKRVQIVSDTSVDVTMLIEIDAQRFIKKNAIASVGTDGLMGNKLVNITNGSAISQPVADGDILKTLKPIETDQMMRTLGQTNENLSVITADLRKITQKLNNSHSLWSLLGDSTLAENVKGAIASAQATTRNTAAFTNDMNKLMQGVKKGNGMLGYLVSDTTASFKLRNSLEQIDEATRKAAEVTKDLKSLTEKIKKGEGSAGVLLSDTTFAHDLSKSMRNIRISSEKLNENMEAMRHNFLFKGYFKDQEKEAKKAKSTKAN